MQEIIGLQHEALQGMREMLDRAIGQAAAGMKTKKAEKARVTLTLDMENVTWTETNYQTGEKRLRSPVRFSYDCGITIKFAGKESGESQGAWEMVDGQRVVRLEDGQMSMLEERDGL